VLVRVLSYHHPSAFLFENAPVLLRHHKGKTW
jgi:site-specific DNA-cytosine methylase